MNSLIIVYLENIYVGDQIGSQHDKYGFGTFA